MASVGGSLTWEAEDLEGELCLGAGVGATRKDKLSQTWRQNVRRLVKKLLTQMTDRHE